jgi:hypothetical protein
MVPLKRVRTTGLVGRGLSTIRAWSTFRIGVRVRKPFPCGNSARGARWQLFQRCEPFRRRPKLDRRLRQKKRWRQAKDESLCQLIARHGSARTLGQSRIGARCERGRGISNVARPAKSRAGVASQGIEKAAIGPAVCCEVGREPRRIRKIERIAGRIGIRIAAARRRHVRTAGAVADRFGRHERSPAGRVRWVRLSVRALRLQIGQRSEQATRGGE